jgi:hypothetical protein
VDCRSQICRQPGALSHPVSGVSSGASVVNMETWTQGVWSVSRPDEAGTRWTTR